MGKNLNGADMTPTWARFLVFLAMAAVCWPLPPALARAEEGGAAAVKPFYRPGEVRNRFDAWEKRARKFESALNAGYAPERFAGIASRLRLIATDIQMESRELARQYDALLESKRKHAAESEAKQSVLIELGYGPDDLRYAANVAAYAKGLASRFEKRASALVKPPGPAPAPIKAPPPAPAPMP